MRIFSIIVFLAGSVPLVWQDIKSLSVSQTGLLLVVGTWVAFSCWAGDWFSAGVAAGVLTLGTAYLLAFPETLGEADIIYMAGLAFLLPFWNFLLAVGLACLLGLTAYLWLFKGRPSSDPLPLLPLLALGALPFMGEFT